MATDMVVKDGKLYGGWRQPINIWMNTGSIHNDAVAQSVGMRGGTIPGTIHLNLFAPIFVELWGKRWWEQGRISMFYTYATTHKEDVRAVVTIPPKNESNVQVEAYVERPDGHVVAKGTVSIGNPKEVSYVRTIPLENAKPGDNRILAEFQPGMELDKNSEVTITMENIKAAIDSNTDPLDWYRGNSPWGGSVLSPACEPRALSPNLPRSKIKKAVGFYGAHDIHNIDGPIKVGVTYLRTSKIACVGASEKTEFLWTDSWLHDKATGKLVAEMRHLGRWMKAGSPVWQEKK